jgi:hypothetical protein
MIRLGPSAPLGCLAKRRSLAVWQGFSTSASRVANDPERGEDRRVTLLTSNPVCVSQAQPIGCQDDWRLLAG